MGVPASPRSFSTGNLSSLAGSAGGLGGSSLGRPVGNSLSRLEQEKLQQHLQQQQQQPASTPPQQPSSSSQQQESSQGQQNSQGQSGGHALGNGGQHLTGHHGIGSAQNLQTLGHASSQQQQLGSSSNLASVGLDSQAEPLQQQIIVPKAEVKQESHDDIHQAGQQHVFQQQRPESLLSPSIQRQDVFQLQHQRHQQQQQRRDNQHVINLFQQQRLLQQQQQQQHQQQQQQQQLLQSLPHHVQQRQQQPQHQQQQQIQQIQQQQQQHSNMLQNAGPPKQPGAEPGMCARRLMHYLYHQRHRPPDNNITFWRKFVNEYFGPRAKKRWCVSRYGDNGRQPTGVFPQDVWHCEICGTTPGRGFETTVEVLPRLCKIKYDSGITEELLFVDIPNEYTLPSGLLVLEYQKAVQESVFEALRVVRVGKLRIIFSPDLKIVSWEFCARAHEELIPRRVIVPPVSQLATIAQKYQNSTTQSGSGGLSMQDMQTNCHLFVTSARQLARNLEIPTVNDLGYTKRYVRCLQISEVVNSMKDLIDFSRKNSMGPIDSLMNFPRRNATAGALTSHHHQQQQQQQQDQLSLQNMATDSSAANTLSTIQNANTLSALQQQLGVSNNHVVDLGVNHLASSVNGSLGHSSNPLSSFSNHLHQNSLTSLQGSHQNSSNSLSSVLQSPNSMQASPTNSISSFQTSLNSISGNLQQSSLANISNAIQQNSLNSGSNLMQQTPMQSAQSGQHDSQHAVQHLLQEMMMNQQQLNGGNYQQGLGGANMGGGGNVSSVLGGGGVGGLGSLGGGGNLGHAASVIGGSSNGALSNHLGSSNNTLGGVGGPLGSTLGSGVNPMSGLGNTLRNVGGLSNLNTVSALNGRLNLGGQHANMPMQDANDGLHHELVGNSMLGSLGAGGGFGSGVPFGWKSHQ